MARSKGCPVTYCNKCRKTAHVDSASAYAHRRELVRSGKAGIKPGVLQVYPCPHGFGWHVGHRNHR